MTTIPDKQKELIERWAKFSLTDEQLDEMEKIAAGEKEKIEFVEVSKEQTNTSPVESFISMLLSSPVAKIFFDNISSADTKAKELENENNMKFWTFLKRIDIVQKIYNLLFIIISSAIILVLNTYNAIGKETSQTLLTLVIVVGISNAISNFFKSSKR